MWIDLVRNYGLTTSLKMLVNLMDMFLQDAGCAFITVIFSDTDKSDIRIEASIRRLD
jgi:hypothetical protein